MKIYVTQGHEEGIGLEVFFKTCLFLSPQELSQLTLIAFLEGVKETLISLRIPFEIHDDAIQLTKAKISVLWLDKKNHSQSFSSLEMGMKLAESGGVLYTLPTSKDQFPGFAGHTEYFRHFYRRPDLGMFFSSPSLQVLLLSDHVPISKLSEVLTEEAIFERLQTALKTLKNWDWKVSKILVSGLNPHAGENGLIGDEDKRISLAIKRLKTQNTFEVSGPHPGDTLLLQKQGPNDVLVYLFHDQGLGVFKGLQGFIGSNITLGLPYPRFSPDHGTSFHLFGMNKADYRGCSFSLKEALAMLKKRMHGQNSSHQS